MSIACCRPTELLVLFHRYVLSLHEAGSAHCTHLHCSGLPLLGTAFLVGGSWFGFSSTAQLVCHLFSTVFPLEFHSGVSGFCPGRVLALGISQSKQRAEIREMTAPCRQQTLWLWGRTHPFWWGWKALTLPARTQHFSIPPWCSQPQPQPHSAPAHHPRLACSDSHPMGLPKPHSNGQGSPLHYDTQQ